MSGTSGCWQLDWRGMEAWRHRRGASCGGGDNSGWLQCLLALLKLGSRSGFRYCYLRQARRLCRGLTSDGRTVRPSPSGHMRGHKAAPTCGSGWNHGQCGEPVGSGVWRWVARSWLGNSVRIGNGVVGVSTDVYYSNGSGPIHRFKYFFMIQITSKFEFQQEYLPEVQKYTNLAWGLIWT
jgi:hypothetical protein